VRTSGLKDEEGDATLPSKQLYIPVNADEVIATGTLPESRRNEIVPQLNFSFGNGIMKGEMTVVDIINQNKWKRPIYFATTVGSQNYLGLDKNGNFAITGMAYRLLPIDTRGKATIVDVEKAYDNVMNKFKFGNVSDSKVYSDETVRRMGSSHRSIFSTLAEVLIAQGDTARAKKVLDKAFEELPTKTMGYDNVSFNLATNYYKVGDIATGNKLVEDFLKQNNEYLRWGFSLGKNERNSIQRDLYICFMQLQNAMVVFQESNQKELFDKYMLVYQDYAPYFQTPKETEMR
jgi:tetratricopeptide (TPR) repeat protein